MQPSVLVFEGGLPIWMVTSESTKPCPLDALLWSLVLFLLVLPELPCRQRTATGVEALVVKALFRLTGKHKRRRRQS